jgi:hypothetical protein
LNISAPATATVKTVGAKPQRIVLLGDKTKKPEAAENIIEFPGGAICVTRTTDGNYWAHFHINRSDVVGDTKGTKAAFGRIVGARIDTADGVVSIPAYQEISHLALLIQPMAHSTEDLTEES